jgi:fructokinase
MALYGAVEAGGTKFVCAVGSGPYELLAEQRIPTTTPGETLSQCIDFFRAQPPLEALGVGSFGPLDLRRPSPTYGHITRTPKVGWSDVDIVGPLARALSVPIGFDTDVNAAVLGEVRWGAARGLSDVVYVTIGTGIGGGALCNGRLSHGLVHPEMGHLLLPREPDDLAFEGSCPFHGGRCWEGLASGPAMRQRWGTAAEKLAPDHPAWSLEARYVAAALTTLVVVLSPQRIVVGGGVGLAEGLLPAVRRQLQLSLGGYVQAEAVLSAIDQYVVPPALGAAAGIAGALALAELARLSKP